MEMQAGQSLGEQKDGIRESLTSPTDTAGIKVQRDFWKDEEAKPNVPNSCLTRLLVQKSTWAGQAGMAVPSRCTGDASPGQRS